jgi:hypothetical protein
MVVIGSLPILLTIRPIELAGVTWTGPEIDDPNTLAELPEELRTVLCSINGFVLFGGALHVRGAVREPAWHSIGAHWRGADALAELYPAVEAGDVPFAQDCVGDQFLLRDGVVSRLYAGTGEVTSLHLSLFAFLERACADPEEFLEAQPLIQHRHSGGELAPGMTLHAYPPFCIRSAEGVSLRPVPAAELIRLQANLARQLTAVPDGTKVRFRTRDG